MSLKPELILEVPELTEEVARAAFPKGNPYLTLRDNLGTIFEDEDFSASFLNTDSRHYHPGDWLWLRSCNFERI
jgi:transposase